MFPQVIIDLLRNFFLDDSPHDFANVFANLDAFERSNDPQASENALVNRDHLRGLLVQAVPLLTVIFDPFEKLRLGMKPIDLVRPDAGKHPMEGRLPVPAAIDHTQDAKLRLVLDLQATETAIQANRKPDLDRASFDRLDEINHRFP